MDGEEQDLAFNIMAEWWITANQALIDKVGGQKAIAAEEPYMRNGGSSSALIIKRTLGIDESGILLAIVTGKFTGMVLHFEANGEAEICENGGKLPAITSCPFESGPLEACILFCDVGGGTQTATLCPGFKSAALKKKTKGADHCSISFFREEGAEIGGVIYKVPYPNYPQELLDEFAFQFLGEIWTYPVKALADLVGAEEATRHVARYMKARGMEAGLRISRMYGWQKSGPEEAISALTLCNKLLHQKFKMIAREGLHECSITACPWSDSTPEVCRALESFKKGIVEAICPEYELYYLKMVTNEEDGCQWVLRKKDSGAKIDATFDDRTNDPLKVLKLRLARGEITKEEYMELKTFLE